MLSPQTNLSHQICIVAKKMCRSIHTTQETIEKYDFTDTNFHFKFFVYTLHLIIFTVEINCPEEYITNILVNYVLKLLFGKYLFFSLSSGPNLDLLFARQLVAALFCQNYAQLYFDVKHFEKYLNRG